MLAGFAKGAQRVLDALLLLAVGGPVALAQRLLPALPGLPGALHARGDGRGGRGSRRGGGALGGPADRLVTPDPRAEDARERGLERPLHRDLVPVGHHPPPPFPPPAPLGR